MKRLAALSLIPLSIFVLAGCSGGSGSDPTGSNSEAMTQGTSSAPSVAPSQPGGGAAESPSTDPSPGANDAGVVGQWGGASEGSPVLWIGEDGRFNGNDGCNTLTGTWMESENRVELSGMTSTLMACPGTNTWLSAASSLRVTGGTLEVTAQDGAVIGTLERLIVAG